MPFPAQNLQGQIFGHWRVLRRAADGAGKVVKWLCVCDPLHGGCGAEHVVSAGTLKDGRSNGCQQAACVAKDAKPTELRLLVQPLFRFEAGNNPTRPDGALFGFSEGTDPMALLLLEVRRTKEGERWHYAVVRMTTFAVAVSHGGKEVYSAGKYEFRRNPKEPFLQLSPQPVPKE